MKALARLAWRLVHLLPWSVTRHVCDLCTEFPFDPSRFDAQAAQDPGDTPRHDG